MKAGQDERYIVLSKYICLGNVGESHERLATNLVIDIANIGGLVEIVFVICWGLYIFFNQPFKDIDLAISFQKLSSMVDPVQEQDCADHEDRLTICFYLWWWVYQRTPKFIQFAICFGKNNETIEHFEELHNKVLYELSLRNLSILANQSTVLEEKMTENSFELARLKKRPQQIKRKQEPVDSILRALTIPEDL